MTAAATDELSRVTVSTVGARRAEASTLLRFAEGLRVVDGRLIVAAQVAREPIARRLRGEIYDLYGCTAEVTRRPASAAREDVTFLVRVVADAESLARQTGLLDRRGRPVQGLPSDVVGGAASDLEGAWRGAFLASGSLSAPGRTQALQVTAPGPAAALALVGAARRLGVRAKAREVRGRDVVAVRDSEAIGMLLARMGADATRTAWEAQLARRATNAAANRPQPFEDANTRRRTAAADATAARVRRALEILGDQVPEILAQAGQLRLQHQRVSLETLGRHADPPLSKDTVAGRIRRLLAMADRHARARGLPNIESALTAVLRTGS
jgi:DNA-binding protein WhiA